MTEEFRVHRASKEMYDNCAVVRTDGSHHKASGDNVFGNMVLQHSRRPVSGFQLKAPWDRL